MRSIVYNFELLIYKPEAFLTIQKGCLLFVECLGKFPLHLRSYFLHERPTRKSLSGETAEKLLKKKKYFDFLK